MKMNVYRNYDFSFFTLLGFRTEAFAAKLLIDWSIAGH